MNWIHQAITEFGETIGTNDLALDAENQLCLSVQYGGDIHIAYLVDAKPPEILVAHTRPLGGASHLDQFRKALRLTDFRSSAQWTVQAAVDDNDLVLTIRIPERSFSLSVLEEALSQLTQMHQSILE